MTRPRLRDLGVSLFRARDRAIGELVLECPLSVVAAAIGYSYQLEFLHAEACGSSPPSVGARLRRAAGEVGRPLRNAAQDGTLRPPLFRL